MFSQRVFFLFILIGSSLCQKFWHSYFTGISMKPRYEFVLKNVSLDEKFHLNSTIEYWRSLNLRTSSFALGVSNENIFILNVTKFNNTNDFNISIKSKEVNERFQDATFVNVQYKNRKHSEIFVVGASNDQKLYWLDAKTLEFVWVYNLGYKAESIKFKFNNVRNRNQLFLTSLNTLYIYDFDVEKKQLWLTETLEVSDHIGSYDVLPFQNRFYLLVPQKSLGLLRVFRYVDDHFRTFKNISAEGIEQVAAFQINYKSFFAVDGLEAGIYQFDGRNRIRLERIVNSHLEGIKYWLPIKVNNLRKNFVLLGQRVLHHGSLKSIVLETFIYNGKNFEEHDDIPCRIFGEDFNTLNCLSSTHESVGIDGAAAISIGDNLGLLMAKKSPNSLFKVNFEVRYIENPIKEQMREMKDIRNYLQNRLDEKLKNSTVNQIVGKASSKSPSQGDSVKTRASFREEKRPSAEDQRKDSTFEPKINSNRTQKIDELLDGLFRLKEKLDKIENIEKRGNFKTLIFSGKTRIANARVKKVNNKFLNEQLVDEILVDIVRKDNNITVRGTKTFSDIDLKNIYFDSINGIKGDDIVFHDSNDVTINGNILFVKPVAIMKNIQANMINGMPASSLSNLKGYSYGTLPPGSMKVRNVERNNENNLLEFETVEHITGESSLIQFPHNVTVRRVNGVDFEEFLSKLCLVNIPNHIPGSVNIKGDVAFDLPSKAGYLNDLQFPKEYVSINDEETVTISGKKVFRNNITTDKLKTNDYYINELKSEDYFTLSTSQEIKGKATFPDVEITKKFLHDGKTVGDNFLPNPTLATTLNVTSNVNFDNLEITGALIVENVDGFNYGRILEDIVYKDEERTIINSIKEFSQGLTIKKNLGITSNSINKVTLDQIVTKDGAQLLNIQQLDGNVSIISTEIQQLIDGVNVTKLDQDSVKTVGEQFISSFLIFEKDLEAASLEVKEKLNEVSVENFYTTTGDRIINQKTKFEKVHVENLSIHKNVEGVFSKLNLKNFTENRLSYSTPQSITEDIVLLNSRTNALDCKENKTLCQVILNRKEVKDEMMAKISSGNTLVKELVVEDNINIDHLNGMPLNKVQETRINSSMIDGNVYFTNLQVSSISEVPIQDVLKGVVYKSDADVEIKGLKTFNNGFIVKKIIETEKLNNVPVENLMTKQGEQIIEAPLQIFGNVTFKNNITVEETINDVSVQEVRDYFEYKDDIFVVKGDVTFDSLMYIDDLDIFGNINNRSYENAVGNIAYLDADLILTDAIEFRGPVEIDGDFEIENHLNGISLSKNCDNIVFRNKIKENTIESPVVFTENNLFAHNLVIETNLITKWMRGLDLEVFKKNAIFLDKGFLEGTYHFQNITLNEKLITKFINKVNMSRIIPLGSDQDIDRLIIDNVKFLNNVTVHDSINGFNLKEEYANSVLSDEDQVIQSEIYFKNTTLIRHNLEVAGLLNGNPIDKIVTTDTNQTLTATYHFTQKTVLESNMYVTGLVNSINMSTWEKGVIKVLYDKPQVITAPWYFGKNLTFEDSLDCLYGIYDFDVQRKIEQMNEQKEHSQRMDSQYEEDHKSICKDIRTLNKESKKQTYKFESLEEMQQLEYNHVIGKTHFFNFEKPRLIISGSGKCTVDIFHLENDLFVPISKFEMGEIDQIISVTGDSSIFFVVKTKSQTECDNDGTFVWEYKNDTMTKLQNIENQQLLQESRIPLTFYGLNKHGVTEFRIDMTKAIPVGTYRKWKIHEENAAFMPRGVGTGLAVRTGRKIIKLLRDEPPIDNEIGWSTTMKGEMKVSDNFLIPGRNNSKMAVIKVGPKRLRKTFLAIVFHEDTVVGMNLDVMKIYEDYSENRVFQEIFTYNPTSFVSLEMENGETLLLILENEEKLQIYRYRGVEGFRRHLSAELPGTHLFKMSLPLSHSGGQTETVGIVRKNKISILKPIMIGNPTIENIECP
ncbi:uncharacterized protein LOC123683798 [Harmonia axyridis]|uniref:uncharacterized protein LOC123683798 n=1 Tax=Harmonia axyridis TaxID=115357 RepID=UPI001E2771E4|nr:uncharacterized protein LOC123683798 [Harmonia axyridis]